MITWVWLVVGAAASIGVSFVVGLALARIFGNIEDAASRLLRDARWAAAPLTREIRSSVELPRHHVERQSVGSWMSD
jgi:hypothetical protein